MNAQLEQLGKNEVKLIIEVPAGELAPAAGRVAERLSQNFKVQGFRPGKAPVQMVKSTVGVDAFNAEVIEEALPETYTKAIKEHDLRPVGSPEVRVTSFDEKEGLKYEATVALIPEVKLPDLAKLKLDLPEPKIEDADVETMIEELRKARVKETAVDRAAKTGDKVEIDFEGFRGGVPFEGGRSQNHPLILGEKLFIPGFEEALEGVKAGEAREFEVTFPADYHGKDLAGQTVTFKTKTHGVFERELPEVDEAFAQGFGAASPDELRGQIRESLEARASEERAEQARMAALEELVKHSELEVPERLIQSEAKTLLRDLAHQLAHQGGTLEQYLHSIGKGEEEILKDLEPEAERRIRSGLVLGEYAKNLEVKVDEAEVERLYAQAHHGHSHTHEEDEAGKEEIRTRLQTRAALDMLVEELSGEKK
jgi:trigger factor